MRVRLLLTVLGLLLFVPGTAFASLADEQRQGQQLAAQLQSGAKSCGDLSGEDFDHIGEYVMGRFLGSTVAHQAMNDRMRLMLGDQGEQRMHELMGRRFSGCAAGGYGAMMGSGTMGSGMMGGSQGGGWGQMMRSGDWSWMMGAGWRNMSRQDWQRLEQRLGASAASGSHHGWSPWAIVGVTLAAVLVAGLVLLAIVRRPFRRPPPAPASP